MELVYTHPNPVLVAQARSAVELAGIECIVRNEYAGGAIGELAPIDTWPELWVMEDDESAEATQLLQRLHAQTNIDEWKCDRCGAKSPTTFDLCWQCANERAPV